MILKLLYILLLFFHFTTLLYFFTTLLAIILSSNSFKNYPYFKNFHMLELLPTNIPKLLWSLLSSTTSYLNSFLYNILIPKLLYISLFFYYTPLQYFITLFYCIILSSKLSKNYSYYKIISMPEIPSINIPKLLQITSKLFNYIFFIAIQTHPYTQNHLYLKLF